MSGGAAIDLNADIGEGFASDAELVPLVSSVNIACGAHAGDLGTMLGSIRLAVRHGAAIGAHPGFADREHFGRRELPINPSDAAELVLGQVRALQGVAHGLGARVGHVKLHGALYNMAARDRELATAVAAALAGEVSAGGPRWALYALAASALATAGRKHGLRVVEEAFADRAYAADGSLVPRSAPGSLIAEPGDAARQALQVAAEGTVVAAGGKVVAVVAGTICIHGDGPGAVGLALRIRAELAGAGIAVRPPAGC
jgi:UPF0271 protein